eukprot:9466568-Pyramimonas_sp.AAC.1
MAPLCSCCWTRAQPSTAFGQKELCTHFGFAACRRLCYTCPEQFTRCELSWSRTGFPRHRADRAQATGIAQGCPPSPYLLLIVMSIIWDFVDKKMAEHTLEKFPKPYLITEDVLYAGDTVVIADTPGYLQKHLDTVVL